MFNVLIPFSSRVVGGGRGGGLSVSGVGIEFYPPSPPSLPHHLYKRIRKNLGSQNMLLELLAAVTLFVKDAFILPIFLLP